MALVDGPCREGSRLERPNLAAWSAFLRSAGTANWRQKECEMSYIDVAIPALIGVVAVAWPGVLFAGIRANPDPKRLRLIRGGGALLLAVAAVYLLVKVAAA